MRLASGRTIAWLQGPRQRCLAPGTRRFRPGALIRRNAFSSTTPSRRSLLTLAIETSCDDTCVALLSKHPEGTATLHYNAKRTSDNRDCRGVNPVVAVEGHIGNLGEMVAECLPFLPDAEPDASNRPAEPLGEGAVSTRSLRPLEEGDTLVVQGRKKLKPDFVSVTRGPGMLTNLSAGLMTAKGIAAAWQVPLLAVNHMQAHAITPQLITAMERGKQVAGQAVDEGMPDAFAPAANQPAFPFLSLLVSGGHTLLVHSRGLNDHRILVSAATLAIGDALDKAARFILPQEVLQGADDVMYGRILESFAFPTDGTTPLDYDYQPPARRVDEVTPYTSPFGWRLVPPLSESRRMIYEFSGFGSAIKNIMDARPDMPVDERRVLAREAMRMLFEHLASRVIFVLEDPALGLGGKTSSRRNRDASSPAENPQKTAPPGPEARVKTLVVSGGVASNRYLMHILRSILDVRGHSDIEVTAPPPALCTDNAAMIAWAGMEMYEAGYTSAMTVKPIRKWPLDPTGEDGGILGVDGWITRA